MGIKLLMTVRIIITTIMTIIQLTIIQVIIIIKINNNENANTDNSSNKNENHVYNTIIYVYKTT